MPRHLLPAFCLSLLLLGCACGPTHAVKYLSSDDGVTLFAAGRTKVPAKVGSEKLTRDVSSFDSFFFAAGGGVMVALAEARYTDSDEKRVDIAARYIDTEGPNWEFKTTVNNGTNWRTQLALKKKRGSNHYALRVPTAVIKGNKIYLFAPHNGRLNGSVVPGHWNFELVVGEITGEAGSKKIEWNRSKSLRSKLAREVNRKELNVFPGYAPSAFLTSNGTIVFSASATNKQGKRGYAILQLKDNDEQWKVSFVKKPKECGDLSLLEWKEKLIRMFSGCPRGTHYAKEYDETTKRWKHTDDALFYVLSRKATSRDFTNVTIGNKTALLFTEELILDHHRAPALSLWMTDGIRVIEAGSIFTRSDNVTSRRLLYTNGELFFIYQDTSKGSGALVFKSLNWELRWIKRVLNTWAENDAYLSKPCNETVPEGASPDTLCVTPMPTDGLIGFFSNESLGVSSWQDEYRSMSVLVSGTKVENGYTFNGAHEWAWWPLGETILTERYNFTKYGMTIVATVTVHETPKGDAPFLTFDRFGVKEGLGLWYRDGQWKMGTRHSKEGHAIDLEIQKEYRMAIVLKNNSISLRVDGKSQGSLPLIFTLGEGSFNISDIYIGGCRRNDCIHMTVTNVFFYNRVLSDTELEASSKTIATAMSTDPEKSTEQAIGEAAVKGSEAPGELLPQSTDSTGSQKEAATTKDANGH